MNSQPLVSVIIPTYNRAHKVCDAIQSVLNQTYQNIQLIVVDDGSTDHTRELLKKYPVEYTWQPNAGQACARNTGLSKARGSVIASLDSDDLWEPDFLATCVTKLENDQLDLVFANWHQIEKDRDWYDYFAEFVIIHPYLKNMDGYWASLSYADLRRLYITTCASPSSGFILRRSSMPSSGWNKQMNIGDDWCLILEMILTKECKAAFTMEKLWRKQYDSMNLYENRNKVDLFMLLYIADVREILRLFNAYLTASERKILQKMHIEGLVEIAKHNLLHEKKIPQFFRLTKQSLALDAAFTFKTMGNVYKPLIERRLKKIIGTSTVE